MSEPLYPVALRLRDRPVLLVGGGPVAARKARRLLACGARITLVAPEAVGELVDAADRGSLRWLRRPFAPGDARGAELVFAATGAAEVDEEVARAAREAGAWLNGADGSVWSDLHLPALLRLGDLTVAVSTGGAAPGFAATLVEELRRWLPPGVGDYVELLRQLRAELRRSWPHEPARRQRGFGAALGSKEARRLAESGDLWAARSLLRETALAAAGQVAQQTDGGTAPGDGGSGHG